MQSKGMYTVHVRALKQDERVWFANTTGASAMPTTLVAKSNKCVTPSYALSSPAADCTFKEAKMQDIPTSSRERGRYPAPV